MAKRAREARRKRAREDTKYAIGKRYRAIKSVAKPILTTVAIGAGTAYYYNNKTKVDAQVFNGLNKMYDFVNGGAVEKLKKAQQRRAGEKFLRDLGF